MLDKGQRVLHGVCFGGERYVDGCEGIFSAAVEQGAVLVELVLMHQVVGAQELFDDDGAQSRVGGHDMGEVAGEGGVCLGP